MSTDIEDSKLKVNNYTTELYNNTETVVSTENSAYVEVSPAEYTLSSGGIFTGGNLTGSIPDWVTKAIQQEIEAGGSISGIVRDLEISIEDLDEGV